MKRVVVTVKRKGEARVQDLELPANVPVGEFLEEMTEVLGWDDPGYSLLAYGPHSPESGETVAETQTLQEAGVSDGFWLVAVPEPGMVRRFQPPKPIYSSVPSETAVPDRDPGVGLEKPSVKTPPMGSSSHALQPPGGTPAPGSPKVKWVNLMPDMSEEPDPGDEDEGWTLREIEDLE